MVFWLSLLPAVLLLLPAVELLAVVSALPWVLLVAEVLAEALAEAVVLAELLASVLRACEVGVVESL